MVVFLFFSNKQKRYVDNNNILGMREKVGHGIAPKDPVLTHVDLSGMPTKNNGPLRQAVPPTWADNRNAVSARIPGALNMQSPSDDNYLKSALTRNLCL